jgi:hypothetical protein
VWGGKIAFVFERGIAMAPGYGEIWYTKPLHWEGKDKQKEGNIINTRKE